MLYPYTTPLVLNDIDFATYGGATGTTTPAIRDIAYTIAEHQASFWLQSFLSTTIITGEHKWYGTNRTIQLDWGRIESIDGVQFVHADACVQRETLYDGIGYVRNSDAGIIDVIPTINFACSCTRQGLPYKVRVAYTSGFPAGTASAMPIMIFGLVTGAKLALQELLEGGMHEGQIGIQEFSSIRYTEIRTLMRDTPFGSSASGIYAAKLLDTLRTFTAGRL